MFFKRSDSSSKDHDEAEMPASPSTSSLRSRAYRLAARAWNHAVYGRWFSDFPAIKNKQASLWLLGKSYEYAQKEEFIADLRTRILLSYREQFDPLCDGKTRTDAGWSCTLRAAQMLVAQALMVNQLGRDWTRCDVSPSELRNVLRSLRGSGLGAAWPPRASWLPPSASSGRPSSVEKRSPTPTRLFCWTRCEFCCAWTTRVVPKEVEEASEEWTKTVLLIVPVRLGVEKVNERYYDHIHNLFKLPTRTRARKYVRLDGTEDDEHYETFHVKSVGSMPIKSLDPSCALGFSVRNALELEQLVRQLGEEKIVDFGRPEPEAKVGDPLFSVLDERPTYSAESFGSKGEANGNSCDEFELI
ncbi:Cysteine protease [Aphelenchoides fujianensis]|nr:Cysteine protease [Aphelenchoides fujianensis]